ncbi:flotillin family protein [Cytophagaceae bacterium ABcell3]|nr:flotillin family protein [Cytophagaceae bacterium ABcell3]
MFESVILTTILAVVFFFFMAVALAVKWYHKMPQGKAIVRTGAGGTKVSFTAMFVIPVLHKKEIMDVSLKMLEIGRMGKDGLICKDNIRADIKVAFFVRVNKAVEDVIKVAQTIGCDRASHRETLIAIFDAKFSEALKTVGRRFDFVDLYSDRDRFKQEILDIIGTELNGYHLDDCAIDYLEQTSMEFLKADNVLDSRGIKKITEITAEQKVLANQIKRDEEKVIKKQDVEAQEAILELNRQLTESEERQQREISIIKSRERAEADKVQSEEKQKSELARIRSEEEVAIAEENKKRQVIVAAKSKERTEAIETERVEKDKMLEATEREKLVSLAQIEKDKTLEEEKKNMQDVIRERVMLEKTVVEQEEKIKDTKALAEATRQKEVALTLALTEAEEQKLKEIKQAEAHKLSAELKSQQQLIEAEADQKASEKQAEARRQLAEATIVEESTAGMAEVKVIEAKANAIEKQGAAEANIMEKKALAEARGIEAKATAEEKKGMAEASVLNKKMVAEAKGIEEKASAMKKLDGVGKEHEEFRLNLEKQKEIELAQISINKDIADAQAKVIGEALRAAKIDIVGGETMFFDKIIGSITSGKSVDSFVQNSIVAGDVKKALLGDGSKGNIIQRIQEFMTSNAISIEDVKNLTITAFFGKLMAQTVDPDFKASLSALLGDAQKAGLANKTVSSLGLNGASVAKEN